MASIAKIKKLHLKRDTVRSLNVRAGVRTGPIPVTSIPLTMGCPTSGASNHGGSGSGVSGVSKVLTF